MSTAADRLPDDCNAEWAVQANTANTKPSATSLFMSQHAYDCEICFPRGVLSQSTSNKLAKRVKKGQWNKLIFREHKVKNSANDKVPHIGGTVVQYLDQNKTELRVGTIMEWDPEKSQVKVMWAWDDASVGNWPAESVYTWHGKQTTGRHFGCKISFIYYFLYINQINKTKLPNLSAIECFPFAGPHAENLSQTINTAVIEGPDDNMDMQFPEVDLSQIAFARLSQNQEGALIEGSSSVPMMRTVLSQDVVAPHQVFNFELTLLLT